MGLSNDRGTFLYRAFQKYLKDAQKNPLLKPQVIVLQKLSEQHKGAQRSEEDLHIPLLTAIMQSRYVSPELLWGLSVTIVKFALIGLLDVPLQDALRAKGVSYMPDANLQARLDSYSCKSSKGLPKPEQVAFLNTLQSVTVDALFHLTRDHHLNSKLERYRQEVAEALVKKRPKMTGNGGR